jgi:D-3-phosphoglycerate dehydrogenase / 2-oxoglutarate reductase
MSERVGALAPEQLETRDLSGCIVVVTARSYGVHDPALRDELERAVREVRYRPGPLGPGELTELVADADGLLAGLDHVDAGVFDHAPRLRVVARYGVGTDRVDLDAAARHGVAVTSTPGANANAVAEMTIALLLAAVRQLARAHDRAGAGEWPTLTGRELAGRTLGLLGLGRIGTLVAVKGRALGLRVVAHDPFVTAEAAATCGADLVGLETLAAESDAVSLHLPLDDATRCIVGREFLERMKPGAVLVNTARGELVDEDALLWGLDHGPLGGAALDVLAQEPPLPDHPLLGRPDVLVTPHIAAHTAEAETAMGRTALDDLLAVLSGREPRFPVVRSGR